MRREENFSRAVAFATATCQFLEVYLKHSLFFRIFVSYCNTITYENTKAGILKKPTKVFRDPPYIISYFFSKLEALGNDFESIRLEFFHF